jgi:hypothetical protein
MIGDFDWRLTIEIRFFPFDSQLLTVDSACQSTIINPACRQAGANRQSAADR